MATKIQSCRLIFLSLITCLAWLLPLAAHEGPEEEIEELTERIAREPESADLFLQRAIEYQVMGKLTEAAKDLERSLRLSPGLVLAQRELARTYFAQGKTNEAMASVTSALQATTAGADRGSLLIVRAELYNARREPAKALADAGAALKEQPDNVEWLLYRSQLQRGLKLTKERIAGLEEGIGTTGSGLLENERVDALIDDGQNASALGKIETTLQSARRKSGWLIRRARVFLATGKAAEAKADLDAAISELNERMTTKAPDPFLYAERGLAWELLGNAEDAKADYEQAKAKGFVEDWLLEKIKSLPKEGAAPSTRKK